MQSQPQSQTPKTDARRDRNAMSHWWVSILTAQIATKVPKQSSTHTKKYRSIQEIVVSVHRHTIAQTSFVLFLANIPVLPSFLPDHQVRPHARSCPKAISSARKHNGGKERDPRFWRKKKVASAVSGEDAGDDVVGEDEEEKRSQM
ncbi:hypothetical protein MMC11_006776 [Xylographa trunciseda]|nr:hypothetical protein [Xylographa trunciseda]